MEVLESFCHELKNKLLDVTDEQIRRDIIFEHIAKVEQNNIVLPHFPLGLDWFNVSQALDDSMLKGKILVLDFFTYCCINCLHIIPHLRRLEEKYSVANGLIVVGVHSAKFENEKNSDKILLALNRYNIMHPVVNDKDCILWNKLNISCWPTLLIVGPDKKLLFVLVGEGHHDELFSYVKSALDYYCSTISSHSLPLLHNKNIIRSNILSFPSKITRCQNIFAVSDTGNHRIIIFHENGEIKFVIGGKTSGFIDGSFEQAQFNSPQGLIFYNSNTLYIADTGNHAIRLACLQSSVVTTIIGSGHQGTDYIGGKRGISQEISSPWDICIVPCPESSISQSSSIGMESLKNCSIQNPHSPAVPQPPPLPHLLGNNPCVPQPPPLPKSKNNSPSKTESNENSLKDQDDFGKTTSHVLLIATTGTHQIWAYFIEEGVWWKGKKYNKNTCLAVAGSGKEENRNNCYPNLASFAQPSGLSYSKELNAVFIADSESSTIRKLSLQNGSVTHVVGGSKSPDDLFSYGDVDGKSYNAKLQHPLAVVWNSKKKLLYVCDTYNHKIKSVDPDTSTCICVSSKDSNSFNEPSGCCVSSCGNFLYVCDTNNNEIKMIDLNRSEIKKVVVKEKSSSSMHTNLKDNWEIERILSKKKSSLKLEFEFSPKEIHGKWKLFSEKGDLTADFLKGTITTNQFSLNLNFSASKDEYIDDDIRFKILFDLVLCGTETCNLKKIILNVLVKRNPDGEVEGKCKLYRKLL